MEASASLADTDELGWPAPGIGPEHAPVLGAAGSGGTWSRWWLACTHVTEAVIGLIGVIVGAMCAGGVEYLIGWRAERLEARAAARLMMDALEVVLFRLTASSSAALPAIYNFNATIEDWREHRGVLARSLTNEGWAEVCEAVQLLASVSGCPRGRVGNPWGHPGNEELLKDPWTLEEQELVILDVLAKRLDAAVISLARAAVGRTSARQREAERAQLAGA